MNAWIAFNDAERRWRLAEESGSAKSDLLRGYEIARELWRRSGKRFQETFTVGQICRRWSDLGYISRTAHCYEEALALARALGDRRQELTFRSHSGDSLRLLGELTRAESTLNAALVLARELRDRNEEATVLNNLALLSRTRGDVHQAVGNYRQALALYRAQGEQGAEAVTLHNLGVSDIFLSRYPEALDVLYNALAIQQRLHRSADQATTLTSIGWVHFLAEDSPTAITFYQEAIKLSRNHGYRPEEAAALDRAASAYRELRMFPKSLDAYRSALSIANELGNRRDIAHTVVNVGWLLQEWEHPKEAKKEFQRALPLFRQLGDLSGLAHALVGLAHAERSLKRPENALRQMEQALTVVDRLRISERAWGASSRADPFWQDYTEFYVDLLMELHSGDSLAGWDVRAFETSDLARARGLVSLIQESTIGVRSSASPDLLSKEQAVQERLNAVEERRLALLSMEEPPGEEIALLERALRRLRVEYDDVQREIRIAAPRFAELRDPEPVPLPVLQKWLDPETLLLSYVLGEDHGFVFLVGRNLFESRVLPGRKSIEQVAKAVYESMASKPRTDAQTQYKQAASKLSEMVLGPVKEKLGKHRLLVVPDDMLHYVSFAALPAPSSIGRELRLLVDDHEIVYLPSVVALAAFRRRVDILGTRNVGGKPVKCLAVIGDPVFRGDDERVGKTAVSERNAQTGATSSKGFARLPFSRQEAESILQMVPQDRRMAALDFAANKELVRRGDLAGCSILHFATHAVIDEEHPELSEIVLSLVDRHGKPVDGHLRLHEIYGLDLPADLVVLSACRTALGRRVRGDGLVGLTRGFAYAGASRLVVSLWRVDDRATAALMTRFYEGVLRHGQPPATALREAQLWLRQQKKWQAPYYWAPFILQGD
ncbi:MAG TPA: CHAT domain-containing tetratricopeptide repeat protein [Thermoanaerobaculia bacterium]|nr:CHAT domain-containing tetratricopeptide repeat protein [Thermoanaerobaculia bacterium]